MELTREILLAQRAKTEADMNACAGAIQTIDWCLEVLEEDEHGETEG
jgi:hypothetical protein